MLLLDTTELFDLKVFAINCPLKAHRFIWDLNQMGVFEFDRSSDLESTHSKSTDYHIRYRFVSTDDVEYFILKNKGLTRYLIPEWKNADYLFCIRSEDGYTDPSAIDAIKNQRNVLMITEIAPEKLKKTSQMRLMF